MNWFTVTPVGHDCWKISEPIGKVEPRFGVAVVNMFLVAGRERAALIDTGMGVGDLRAAVRELTDLPVLVCNTHSHWDHCGSNSAFDQIAIHQSEVDLLAKEQNVGGVRKQMETPAVRALLPPDFDPAAYHVLPSTATLSLCDTDKIDLGGRILQVLHTPGHSPGHVAYFDAANGMLFSGDTAYRGPMYACFKGSDPFAFQHSAQQLARMADDVQCIAPGHNEILQGGGFLHELASAANAAVNGDVQSQPADDFIGGRAFRFDGFSLWFPKE